MTWDAVTGGATVVRAGSNDFAAEVSACGTRKLPGVQPTPAPPAPGVLRVPYVPEIVKNQIRDEVKKEVLAEACAENWAQPNAIPEWSKRIKLYGDFRFRDDDIIIG